MPSSLLCKDPFGPPWRFDWIRMLITWDGGILQAFWIEWLSAATICAIAMTISYFALRDSQVDEISDGISILADASSFVARRFQAAVALMLGFYSKLNLSRWTSAVETQAKVEVEIHNLALRIARKFRSRSSVSGRGREANEGNRDNASQSIDVVTPRTKLVRWLNLSHAIVIKDVCQMRTNRFSSLEKIAEFGLVTEVERDFLATLGPHEQHIAPFVWFLTFLMSSRKMMNHWALMTPTSTICSEKSLKYEMNSKFCTRFTRSQSHCSIVSSLTCPSAATWLFLLFMLSCTNIPAMPVSGTSRGDHSGLF